MTIIKYFAVHHAGGLGTNRYASTQHLTLQHINNAHQRRWPRFKSEMGYWVGYNVLLFPDGTFIQTRLIGEETAAQKYHNEDTFSVCIMGNQTKDPRNFNNPVDIPTTAALNELIEIEMALLDGDPERVGLKVKNGTILDVKFLNIVPHRFLQWSECYGTAFGDKWARELAKGWYARRQVKDPERAAAIKMQKQLDQLSAMIADLMRRIQRLLRRRALGAIPVVSCIEDEDVLG